MSLSLCLLTKNHRNVISKTIDSVKPLVDEVLVLDYGSTDDTMDLAHRSGAKVISSSLREGFSELRNRLLEEVKSDWVLFLEPGDLVPIEEQEKIKKAISLDYDAFICKVVYPNKSFNDSVRLFRSKKGFSYKYRVYETIGESIKEKNGKIGNTDIVVLATLVKQVPLFKQYSELLENDFREDPENEKLLHLMAMLKADSRDFDEAEELMQKAIDKVPHYERYKNDLKLIKEMRDREKGGVKFNFS